MPQLGAAPLVEPPRKATISALSGNRCARGAWAGLLSKHGMNILAISATFPSSTDPSRGVFVKERLKALALLDDVQVRVLAPTPWFPPLKRFSKWYRWSQFPYEEQIEGLPVYRPRYFLPPKVGGYVHPQLMHAAIVSAVDRIYREFRFDVLDAHYVYPAGALAVRLADRFNVPVVMTGRGEDMMRFPELPLVGNQIRRALKRAQGAIGVSQEIATRMLEHGASPDRTHVIANGVDTEKFYPKPQQDCRHALGLPLDGRIIVSVGDLLELKGFHLLVEAMPEVLRHEPKAMLIIVGGPGRFGRDHSSEIRAAIDRHQLHAHVRMVGARPHGELIDWYNAADLYAMMSSREGSPNVLLEALACGTPAIGTPVGGIPDELQDSARGELIPERTSKAAAATIVRALARSWDRQQIRGALMQRTWEATAQRVHQVLRDAVEQHAANPQLLNTSQAQ